MDERPLQELVRLERAGTYTVLYESADGNWELRRTRAQGHLRWDEVFISGSLVAGSSTFDGARTCAFGSTDQPGVVDVACRGEAHHWQGALEAVFFEAFEPKYMDAAATARTIAGHAATCFSWDIPQVIEICYSSEGIPLRIKTQITRGFYEATATVIADNDPAKIVGTPLLRDAADERFASSEFALADVTLPELPRLASFFQEQQ